MKKYSLKVESPYDDGEQKVIVIDKDSHIYERVDGGHIWEKYIVRNGATLTLDMRADMREGRDKVADIYHEILLDSDNAKAVVMARGVVAENNKIIYRSNIKTEKNYKNLKGQESMHFVMLDTRSEVDAIPMLEIENNMIESTHSMSITRIDNKKRFYMLMHGLEEKEAEQLYVESLLR